jgi:hypothetical protein
VVLIRMKFVLKLYREPFLLQNTSQYYFAPLHFSKSLEVTIQKTTSVSLGVMNTLNQRQFECAAYREPFTFQSTSRYNFFKITRSDDSKNNVSITRSDEHSKSTSIRVRSVSRTFPTPNHFSILFCSITFFKITRSDDQLTKLRQFEWF